MRIEAVTEAQFERLLPLIAAYQKFYEADDVATDRNRAFFRRFLAPSDDGLLLAAWTAGGDGAAGSETEALGYACLYWHFSSTEAVETVLMNDLFVSPSARGAGVGRALIEASLDVTRTRGAPHLEWMTAPDNGTAQRLYDSVGAERSVWVSYELSAEQAGDPPPAP